MSKNLRILLVEDNQGDADLILEFLPGTESLRYEIEHVTRLATALKRIRATHFDVIFLDLGLPDSSGLETIHSMRKGASDTPIIVITGNSDEQLDVDAIQSGLQDFIVKGQVNAPQLSRIIRLAVERHQIAEKLRKSEEQWRSFVATIPDYVGLLDIEGNYLFLNHYAKGFSKKDVIGKNAADFILPESRELFISYIQKCLKTQLPQQLEYFGFGDRNSTRTYEGFLVPIIENDRVVSILSLARDITEHKQAEENLRNSEENFRNLFENATVGLYRTTPDGKILLANPTLVKMLGYESFEELTKRNLEKDGFEPGYKRKEFKKRVENDTFVQGLEIAWQKKDGTEIYVRESSKAIRDANGKVQYYEGTVEDITRRRRDEELLRLSEERFRTLFEQAAVGVALLDTKTGQYVRINQRYCDLLGYTIEEMLTKTFQDVTHPDDVQTNIDNNALLLHGTINAFSIEKRYIRKDGTIVWGKLTASPLWKPGTKPDSYFHIAVVEDIAERKKVEQELARSVEELRKRNEDLERFNKATVGRELRMIELKKQINELSRKCGQPAPYSVSESDKLKSQRSRTKK